MDVDASYSGVEYLNIINANEKLSNTPIINQGQFLKYLSNCSKKSELLSCNLC